MSETTPKYILVEKHIRQAIRDKTVTDKLPGERTLATQLGVSYMTVRKSVENLVSDGVLYKVPTKGTFVNKDRERRKKTRTIGFFLDSSIGMSSPYYSLIFNAIEKVAARDEYSVVYFSDNNHDQLVKTLSKLDGVIATCMPRIEHVILEMKQTTPVVVIDNSAADKTIPSVIIDNFNADLSSVDYICSLGHKRIGFMGGLEDSEVGKSRFAGYQYGLTKNSIPYDPELVFRGNYYHEAGIAGAEYFLSLDSKPTAIICANDSMALGAIQKFNQLGMSIPKDMSIIGFDDIQVASQIVPALTTIAAPVDGIAQTAFSMLKNLIHNLPQDNKHIALSADLKIRQSCAEITEIEAA